MYQEKSVAFATDEQFSTDKLTIEVDPMIAIQRGRALRSRYLRDMFRSMGASVKASYRSYRSRVELMKMDDRMLADIGITRSEAAAIASGRAVEDDTRKSSHQAAPAARPSVVSVMKAPEHLQAA